MPTKPQPSSTPRISVSLPPTGSRAGSFGQPRTAMPTTSANVHAAVTRITVASLLAHGVTEEGPRDDQPLALARPLVDLGDLGIAVVPLRRELLRVAVAAENLDRLAGLAARDR